MGKRRHCPFYQGFAERDDFITAFGYRDRVDQAVQQDFVAGIFFQSLPQDFLAFRIIFSAIWIRRLARDAIEQIPEIYFTKLELAATLLKGQERFIAVFHTGITDGRHVILGKIKLLQPQFDLIQIFFSVLIDCLNPFTVPGSTADKPDKAILQNDISRHMH